MTLARMLCDARSDLTNVNQYCGDTIFTQSFGIDQLLFGKFCVIHIVMPCATLAFNVLRVIGQEVIARAHLTPIKNEGATLALENSFAEHRLLRRWCHQPRP